ncbi:carbon-nitrogen hydrolase [Rhodothermus marinus]|jgi:N-carbamoylputrescine amidase|uniref:carbon-nitrogen hydrolase n=1 Tax=Rhodothermus marinus TaxID=29549 RepID=UPI000223D9AF|nr:carbon-nitrogen hydrolase [Rhodothermus marinus]AEN73488.1 N-carbamoylputrescine amidase [Rhodothermus marinus SG0.5JP17-172]MBO2491217.1 carbon-nitrogen hydrolase [Rhodothermus marinus]BBM69825.1 apolipoprotein acyltransferase [Rhodothermus marinus]BBM72811.1 apolipoprotein acyltransferase [Rhodothermus marinus]
MPETLKVGLVQMRCGDDPARNLERAVAGIREAARQGARIVCLPELFRTPYFCKHEDPRHFQLAEPVPGPTTEELARLAAELNVSILASLFEKRADGLYHNTLAVLDPERGYLGKYRKMHIPHDPLFEEKYYFAPGDLGFRVFDTAGVRIGTLICWDQWFPEAARLTALQGAQILFYPTAIGWLPEEEASEGAAQHEAWELVQRAHAITNGCYVVAVNRTGFEPAPPGAAYRGIRFWGQSFVAAPDGTVLARAPVDEEAVLVVELDLSFIDRFRTTWPFFRDRRIDAYAELTRRFLDARD